jgi:hypothetical protein
MIEGAMPRFLISDGAGALFDTASLSTQPPSDVIEAVSLLCSAAGMEEMVLIEVGEPLPELHGIPSNLWAVYEAAEGLTTDHNLSVSEFKEQAMRERRLAGYVVSVNRGWEHLVRRSRSVS